MDEQDSSVTRPLELYREIFTKANLDCYRQMKQRNFPKSFYAVYMFALRPLVKIYDEDESKRNDKNFDESDIVSCNPDKINTNINVCEYNNT